MNKRFYNIRHEDYEERILRNHKHQELLFRLADRLGALNISFQTETRTLTNGDETFQAILDGLKRAKHHIHMEYYIVRDDKLGTEIKDILIQKSKEGVVVRFYMMRLEVLNYQNHILKN